MNNNEHDFLEKMGKEIPKMGHLYVNIFQPFSILFTSIMHFCKHQTGFSDSGDHFQVLCIHQSQIVSCQLDGHFCGKFQPLICLKIAAMPALHVFSAPHLSLGLGGSHVACDVSLGIHGMSSLLPSAAFTMQNQSVSSFKT